MSEKPSIWCIIAASETILSIDYDETMTVRELKQAVKDEVSEELKGHDAAALELYYLGVEFDESGDQKHLEDVRSKSKTLDRRALLESWRDLSIFADRFSKRILHFLVMVRAPPAALTSHGVVSSQSEQEVLDILMLSPEVTVKKSIPTLLDYLLPHQDFKNAHLPKLSYLAPPTNPPPTGSVTTSPFDPSIALDWNRIPVQVHVCDLLPRMHTHFRQVLLEYPSVHLPATEGFKMAHPVAVERLEQLRLRDEASVSRAADTLMSLVIRAYRELTGSTISSHAEVPSSSQTVVTDYVISRGSEGGQVLVLWENKAPATFQHCTNKLQCVRSFPVRFNLNQVRWEGYQAILAKLAWHSSDLEQKPQWAILYGGNDFMVIYITYVQDVIGIDRPILYCSNVYPAMSVEFPLTAVALYMVLTAETSSAFLQYLEPPSPSIPAALNIKDSNLRQATVQELADASVINIKVVGDRTAPRQLIRVGVDQEEEEVHRMLLNDDSMLSEKGRAIPTIFVAKPPEEGSCALVYHTPDKKVVVKISHSDKDSRAALQKEAVVYDGLGQETWARKFGLFELGKKRLALVLSNEGEPVCFKSMSNADRLQTLESLRHLHRVGINHGDVAERNIVQRHGHWPVVIDFSHAQYHVCKGEDHCEELIEAKVLLKPTPEGFPQKAVVGMVLMLFIFIVFFTTQYTQFPNQLIGLLSNDAPTTRYYPLYFKDVL